jgi:hypothetical protein
MFLFDFGNNIQELVETEFFVFFSIYLKTSSCKKKLSSAIGNA